MKANNGKGDIPERDEWETPQWLFDILDNQYLFSLDCCANERNKKIDRYFNDFLNVKQNNPNAIAWMNPPFSKSEIMFNHFFKEIKKGIAIYRCDNFETKIWQEKIFPNASWVFIPNKRIAYEGMEGKGSRFPSALIGFNVEPPKELSGTTLYTDSKNKEGEDGN
jgi:site-specific DNA-methyltransferase (adenine-specific)